MIKNISILFLLLIFILLPTNSYCIEKNVTVSVPSYDITLNDTKINNINRQYPLISYKDLTYFPMTWFDCRFLGLETSWSNTSGLSINKAKVTSSYEPYYTKTKNLKTYTASIPTFNISINGINIDNSKEEYPLLNFRNVTYFPLTYKFAHDTFGWSYSYTAKNGLKIDSDNPKISEVNLINKTPNTRVAKMNDYYYYYAELSNLHKQVVYRVPINDLNKYNIVYERNDTYVDYNGINFYKVNNIPWIFFHEGTATGSDNYCKLDENEKFKRVLSTNAHMHPYEDGCIQITWGIGQFKNNLEFVKEGQDLSTAVKLSNSNYTYSPLNYDLEANAIIEDWFYAKADNSISKINLKTKEQILLVNEETDSCFIENKYIYYQKQKDNNFYRSDLNGKSEVLIPTNPDSYYNTVLNGNIYYVSNNNIYKANTYENKLISKGQIKNMFVKDSNLFCIFDSKEDYGVQVFDKNGDLKLKITDHPKDVFIDNNHIMMSFEDVNPIKVLDFQ